MNLDDNQFNLENYILNNIKLIYETLSINKSIFIIQSFLLIALLFFMFIFAMTVGSPL